MGLYLPDYDDNFKMDIDMIAFYYRKCDTGDHFKIMDKFLDCIVVAQINKLSFYEALEMIFEEFNNDDEDEKEEFQVYLEIFFHYKPTQIFEIRRMVQRAKKEEQREIQEMDRF